MKTKLLIVLFVLALVGGGGYVVWVLQNSMELDEASPLAVTPDTGVKDALDSMSADERARFDREVDAMRGEAMEKTDAMPPEPRVAARGTFKPRAHEVAGEALLIEGGDQKILRFENFETINGPNLHVYLASDLSADDFVDLGKIRATKGNVNYEIPASVDTQRYNKVLVWCVPFSIVFSYAELR